MSKRLTFKSLLSFIVILFTAFVLVACGENNQELVDTALSDVALVFATNDSATSVTQNLTLPTSVGEDITITWSSDKANVISNAGVVVRPAAGQADATVVLTGTLTMGDATATKAFTLIVKAMVLTDQQVVDAAVPTLAVTYATGDSATLVTGDLVLPATVGTVAVTWASNTPAVVSNAGVVVRPAKGEADATVVLTATLTKGTATATKTFTLTVRALQYTDQELVDMAVTPLMVGYTTGDTVDMVTGNLTLAATSNTAAVAWTSDTPAVISNAGVVVRPAKGEADATVVLTATLTIGTATATKTFTLTVLATPYTEVEAAAALEISGTTLVYNETTLRYTTTGNITLPAMSLGLDVVWTSGNEDFIGVDGTVVRPAYGETDSTVILTATIGDEIVEFVVTVSAIVEKPASLILSEAKAVLLLDVGDGVAADLTLPTTVGSEGVTVTWISRNLQYITDAGVVTRPSDAPVTVTLTATLHLGDNTVTKDFSVIVLPYEPYLEVADIAAAIAAQVAADDDVYVQIPDLTVVATWTTGYMLYDGTTLMQVYKVPTAEIVEGAVFTVRGVMTNYFGALEIVGNANMPIVLIDSNATAQVLTPEVITSSLSDYIATLPTYPLTDPVEYKYVQVTVKVQVDDPLLKYETFLVNTDHDGSEINVVNPANFTYNAFMIYYVTNLDAVRAYDGLEVTINIFVFGQRSDKLIYYVLFTGEAEDIQTSLDDAGIINVAKSALTASFDAEYTVESTIDLPTSMLGATIVWDTASEYVDLDTGLVTMPIADGLVDVTLTGTITRGTVTDTVTITFKVGRLAVATIGDVIGSDINAKIRTVGVVTTAPYYRTYFIQDATGGIAIYTSDSAMLATLEANLGKEVEVFGSRAVYSNMAQISPTSITLVGDGVMPTAMNVDAVALNATDMFPYSGQLVEMTGLYVSALPAQSFGNVVVVFERLADGTSISMKWDSRQALSTEAAAILAAITVGQFYDVVNPLAWANGPFLYFTDTTELTAAVATDTDLAALDGKELDIPATFEVAGTLTLAATGTNGSAIAWTSSNDLLIDPTTGVVTLPATGVEIVTLTATLTLNAAEVVITFDVAVGNEPVAPQAPDLIISEYVEGAPGNRKAIELFNPTSEAIVLTGVYTLALNVNANDYWATAITLTGSIAAGETFVVYNDDSELNDMLGTFGDFETTSLSFNGDDAVGLFKDGVLLDLFGVFGVDPGAGWDMGATVEATKDHVITRNASILIPSIVWNVDEWIVEAAYVDGAVTTLGLHTAIVATELFISEYVEGSSNGSNRAIEIYNGTGAAVDLTGYTLELYKGGSATVSESYTLTGTLEHGQVFILTNTGADQAILDLANDAVDYPGVPFFTGDDAITLSKDGSVIDMFGVVGEDPGDFWVVGTGSTQNYTLVRKVGVLSPVGTWDVNEWDVYPSDTIMYLGTHSLA